MQRAVINVIMSNEWFFCGLFAAVLKAFIRARHHSRHLGLTLDRIALTVPPFPKFFGLGFRIVLLRTSPQGLGVLCFCGRFGCDFHVRFSLR
jgi:hypothetical protein